MSNLNRRMFLRGLGGALVAAPFLSSVWPRAARAKSSEASRTILMFTHYGCITNKWFPKKLDGELTAADLEPTTLAPLAPFAAKLLLPRGLRSMNEWTKDNRGAGQGRGQGNDLHTQVLGSALTCQPVTPNSNDPFSFEASSKFNAMPIGPSLDHVIAQQRSPGAGPLLMNVAGQLKEGASTAISYSAAETRFSAIALADAYAKLTGLFDPSAPVNADSWEMAKGKLLADIVRADLETLMRKDLSKADREKLAQWLELHHEVGRVVAAECRQDTATRLGATNELAGGEGDVVTRRLTATMDNADLYSAVAALAATCDVSSVIVLKYPADFIYTGLGIDVSAGHLSNRLGDASLQGPCLPNAVQDLLKLDAYYAQKFTNLVKMLDGIGGEDGSVLDGSVAIWMNECSDGCAHNLNNAPIVQAGSAGGYFKTGRIIHLDAGSGATEEDMLGRSLSQCTEGTTTMVDALGQGTGTDPRFGNAPINKYFCNVMKAMGLRADAAGYPAKDGPESEVTHFGYSDKTEDFCGGAGAVPGAQIHDPGAFRELEAS